MATSEILRTVTAFRKGEIDALTAARRITKLRFETTNPDDETFMPFRAIESDTDRFPVGEARRFCAPDYLQRVDSELATYLKVVTPELLKACDELIARFDGNSRNEQSPSSRLD